MTQMNFVPQEDTEYRYDPAMLQKVTVLASRLQEEHKETLTAQQMEAIGAEVGLEPAFVRQALSQLAPPRTAQTTKKTTQSVTTPTTGTTREFYAAVLALAFPLAWGTLAYFITHINLAGGWYVTDSTVSLARFFSLLAPVPLAALQGFLTGKKGLGALAGATLGLALSVTFPYAVPFNGQIEGAIGLPYVMFGVPFLALLGGLGAKLRENYFPLPSAQAVASGNMSRADLLNTLFTLQRQLQEQRQRRAFLSVDVVDSTGMKRGISDLAIEHTFGQFRQWLEGVVVSHGGQMQSAAGDGMMCLFAEDAAAIRAARALQTGLPSFNAAIAGTLPQTFRIRCGVSAGEVALEEGATIGHLHSLVIDRAAILQKHTPADTVMMSGELAVAAYAELGHSALTPETVNGEVVFLWRGRPATGC